MEPFFELREVVKSFDDAVVVRETSLTLARGEVFSLLGPSGCGKTTLLKIIAGFEQPDRGRIFLDGTELTGLPPNQRPVNTIFQNYALFPHLSVRENIAFGPRIARRSKEEIRRETGRMLEVMDMTAFADRRPTQISGGQKQRVAIARALINRPKLLLLDEPLAALDLKLRQRMLLELDRIHDDVGITFLYVTHDQGEAMSLSDRIGVMNAGRIEQIGSPEEIYETPANSFVAAFIGDTNFLLGQVEDSSRADYSRAAIEGLGSILVYNDRPLSPGERIFLSLRPEKLRLRRDKPDSLGAGRNAVAAVVEDVIYLGGLTRYRVRSGDLLLSVEHQHSRFVLDEQPPSHGDSVWVNWNADDGYLLRSFNESDLGLLPLAERERATHRSPSLQAGPAPQPTGRRP
ncbi:MAG TPA: ABC transporter ATP-binding protein [Verrucomicrobiales bacterium]|nr:ABC transporter ATP-binding protein [Verrucomicrobiales bacterium]